MYVIELEVSFFATEVFTPKANLVIRAGCCSTLSDTRILL